MSAQVGRPASNHRTDDMRALGTGRRARERECGRGGDRDHGYPPHGTSQACVHGPRLTRLSAAGYAARRAASSADGSSAP
jgi:hypothetical protein